MGNCFTVREHPNERLHGSTDSGCLIVVITHKFKELFVATNGHHIQSSEEQTAILNASGTNATSSRVHPTVEGEIQTPEQNQGRENQTPEQDQGSDTTLDTVPTRTTSTECVMQTQTEVNTDTNEASENQASVLPAEQLLKTNSDNYFDRECPTCLEEYEPENPKIVTKCSHHFHLSCIYAWMERSDKCPMCLRVMEFDENG